MEEQFCPGMHAAAAATTCLTSNGWSWLGDIHNIPAMDIYAAAAVALKIEEKRRPVQINSIIRGGHSM